MRLQINTKNLIRMLEVDALNLIGVAGGQGQVTVRDGRVLVVNKDLNLNRVNLEIKQGRVDKCYVG